MFESIQGQENAVRALIHALTRPVHSYVFYGTRGTYVEETARIFASRLLDPQGGLDDRVQNHLHPDVIEYEPSSSTYRVKEDVRDNMLVQLQKASVEAPSKVLIVHDAHLLRSDSANTLLKSLEEPPHNTYWILVAPSVDSLIATIRSRCYPIFFSRLKQELIEDILVMEGVHQDYSYDISRICAGRIDRARKLAGPYKPLYNRVQEVVDELQISASSVASCAANIISTINEISSDVTVTHKNELTNLKKQMKDSGYIEKIAASIISNTKTQYEQYEKKLHRELIIEFLDLLQTMYINKIRSESQESQYIFHVGATINRYRSRLIYNPSEQLFLESLLSSIISYKIKVNS